MGFVRPNQITTRRTQKNVGVIGLGIIGSRVAACVRRAGFSTFVWNRTPRPLPNFVGSPTEIAELCDFIQIFVSDDEALLQVLQRMKQALGAHHVVLAHSTVSPATTRAAAEIIQRRGAQLLDAPFTGSKLAAEKGELVYYIGGDDAAYRRARPVLEASSKEIIEIGDIGQATTIKIATNMVTAATVQVAAEAMALVHNSGLPLEKFAEAMQGNGSNSGTLKMKLPKMLQGDFEAHFSVKHMLKDIEIASRMARSYGLALPATEAARDGLLEEARQGRNDEDYSSIARAFFPSGPPGKMDAKQVEEKQSDLLGLDERASHQKPTPTPDRIEREPAAVVERAKEVVARNGSGTIEVPREELTRDDVVEAKKIEEPVAAKAEEPVVAKVEEPIVAKVEEPIVLKVEEPTPPKLEEPEETIAEKRSESHDEKREEAIVAKADESAKQEKKVEEKRVELIEDKREEPIIAKAEEPAPEKKEKLSEEKREELVEAKREEPVEVKKEEAKEPEPEKLREEIAASVETKPLQTLVSETAAPIKEIATLEKEEEPEPRRSFLSRLFGKADS